ncbi:MAG: NEW3 domain-containing protein [Candidatus Aenigmatarchaeota archaeon]
MEKSTVAILILIFLIFLVYFVKPRITGFFIGFSQPTNATWFNTSWHYRLKIVIFSPTDRVNWPIEIRLNFSDLIPSGTFDENSIRVIEYDSYGKIIQEVPSQFDKDENYDASTNAIGTLVFILNGTTSANTNRTFYVYYDILENGAKAKPNYETNITYWFDSLNKTINVNTTSLAVYIDTNRGLNISGIYKVVRKSDEAVIVNVGEDEKPVEYIELTNSTHNFTFDLRYNFTIIPGPVRITVVQKGNEVLEGDVNYVGEASIVKKYYFYNLAGPSSRGSFLKIEQKILNPKDYYIQRASTPAGALALDLNRSFLSSIDSSLVFGNSTNPFSYYMAATQYGNYLGALINLEGNETYFAKNETETLGRIGIHLDQASIPPNSFLFEKSLVYFGAFTDPGSEFENVRIATSNPETIDIAKPEVLQVHMQVSTNATIYNRNETLLLTLNITYDPYKLARYANATFDFGTLDKSDDITISLTNISENIFQNAFTIPASANTGEWKINVTVYDDYYNLLNSTIYAFNVTDILKVYVSVENKMPIEGTQVNASITVKNYREDSFILNASVNCSVDSSLISVVDLGNGTYFTNFTAPPYGSHNLTCNASKDNNFGQGYDSFFSQAANTSLKINVIPDLIQLKNVTLKGGEVFNISVNISNTGKAKAYNVSISFNFSSDWQVLGNYSCDDIDIGSFCERNFTITSPSNILGNFTFLSKVTWKNPDYSISSNFTYLNLTVLPNPLIDVLEDYVIGIGKDGLNSSITSFTVLSIGNTNATNISFSCISNCIFNLTFSPPSIQSLQKGENSSIEVFAFIPLDYSPGSYNLTINASSSTNFDVFTLSIIIQPNTSLSIDAIPQTYTAKNITLYTNESFSFVTIAKNILNSSAKNVNISLILPSSWISNSTQEYCGNLTSGQNCSKSFNVTIASGTLAGIYDVKVNVSWVNLDGSISSNSTIIKVNVTPNPRISVIEKFISVKTSPSTTISTNFTILSSGNYRVEGIAFNCSQGIACKDFQFSFYPSSLVYLDAASNYSIKVNITIPFNYLAGSYNATINVSTTNNGFDLLTIQINISENRTWDLHPTYCKHSEYPSEGIACEIYVDNLGNANITFQISPTEGNYTKPNITDFTVLPNSTYVFSILYNVTGVEEKIYNSTFTVSALEDATPQNKTILVTLLPYTPPFIKIWFDKDEIEQNQTLKIFANITDKTGSGIKYANVSVTRPNNIVDNFRMNLLYSENLTYTFYIEYPQDIGSTYEVGIYNVSVYSEDNLSNLGINYSSFKVRKSFVVFLSTYSDKYYQGDTGSIYYSVKDFEGNPLENVSVDFLILNPNKTILYSSHFLTNKDGTILPLPTFFIPSDALVGNYTLIANSSYNISGVLTQKQNNFTFSVLSRAVTVVGLFADLTTSVVWYPDNIMKFGILVYNGEGKPVDADYINLTVYDPAGNIYFSVDSSQIKRESQGFYTYKYAMPASTASGMYLAVLNVSKGDFWTMKLASFRVSEGGPFDVKVTPLEYEVPQGGYLDFTITVINMGEVSQDVFLEYWVSSLNETNKTYFYASEAVYSPYSTTKNFLRTAYIYNDQPLGDYLINVKMTYSNVKPSIIANASFKVVSKPIVEIPIPTGRIVTPAPIPIVTSNLTAGLIIERYNKNISVARNSFKVELVTVRNTGSLELNNITLLLVGIPLNWFNITPSNYFSLKPNQTAVFAINFNIPSNANLGSFPASLVASSNLIGDQKDVTITIYRSMKELLEEEISKVEDEFAELVLNTKIAEKEGKDVSVVKSLITDIEKEIKNGRANLNSEKYEDALKNIENAKLMIERAKDLLSKLEVKVKAFVIPIWLIVSIAGIAILLTSVTIFLAKRRKQVVRLSVLLPITRIAELVRKKPSKEELIAEKDKILRSLKVLEKSRAEGLITESAYKAMKKALEEKLEKIERKLS